MSDELILPRGPVMVPIGILFDPNMQPVVRDTYIQLLALAGGNMRIVKASWPQFIKMTNKSRSVIYGHLGTLKQAGLIVYTASSGMLWVEFLSQPNDYDPSKIPDEPSKIPDEISDEIPISGRGARIQETGHTSIKRLKDSTKGPKDLPSSSTSTNYVSESGFIHGSTPLSDEIRASLKSIGIWSNTFDSVALHMQKDGWTDKQVMATIEELKLMPGENPALFMWRLSHNVKPKAIPIPSHPITKPDEGDDSALGKVYIAYENEIGYLNPFISESLVKAVDEFSELWVFEAIREAALNSGKSFRYVEKILLGWKQHGFKVDAREKSRKPTAQRVSAGHELDHILEDAPIFAEDIR